jgi:hypothetical protein
VSISDKKCDRPRGEGAERVKPTVCILGAEAKALSADNECMLSAQLSVRGMRPAKLSILFAQLCCLSAGRHTVSISDKKCDRPRGEGAERRQPTVCILGAEAKALSADNECMLSAQLSVRWMRPAKLSILFAGLCCLSAGRDTASISDKKCDRPRGEGAERRQPTVCILGAEAKALSADKRFPCKRVVLQWFFYSFGSTKSSSLRRVWTMRGQKLRRF